MPDHDPVQGTFYEAVTIPCTFERTPEKPITDATVLWWKTKAYDGPSLYQCERKGASTGTGNCSMSDARYSFAGDLTQKNISLRINHVTFLDTGVYFCRIMLEDQIDYFTHPNGVALNVKVPQKLERIYLQTTVTGEHWVTCEVSGHPLPKVTWVQPENISNLSTLNNTSYMSASFSLSVTPNTNYSCQTDGQNGKETQSILYLVPVLSECDESLNTALIVGFASLVVVMLVLNVIYCFKKKGPVAQDKWSMTVPEVVTVWFREDAVLPCTFTAPSQVQPSVTVIWRHKFFKGPEIFRCISKANEAEGGQNCSKSFGRYSLYGDPKTRNLSLIIKDVSVEDQKQYFCRVELNEGSYEAPDGTELKVQVPQTIESIYIRTLASGEQVVTCDVTGIPLPNVTWIMPENINASLVSFLSEYFRASSFVPAYLLNTNYTCQIDGKNGLQNQSIYFSGRAAVQERQISLLLFVAVVTTLTAIFTIIIIILVIVIMRYRKDSSKTVGTAQQTRFGMMECKSEDIYANM
ncbi:uncharacterized protein LOC134335737 [Trichomycterus rosablanca]|uniref:uncharacterized protein LOC134335737 n=1 Tax=Trichomycterus rosablanca TaxID=2290929 RepID=UPI002F34FD1A